MSTSLQTGFAGFAHFVRNTKQGGDSNITNWNMESTASQKGRITFKPL
jgi:hypothetical protein